MKYHKKLKVHLFEREIDHKTLADKLGKCQTYLSHRITGKKPFTNKRQPSVAAFII